VHGSQIHRFVTVTTPAGQGGCAANVRDLSTRLARGSPFIEPTAIRRFGGQADLQRLNSHSHILPR
jgi:hypothetical protein